MYVYIIVNACICIFVNAVARQSLCGLSPAHIQILPSLWLSQQLSITIDDYSETKAHRGKAIQLTEHNMQLSITRHSDFWNAVHTFPPRCTCPPHCTFAPHWMPWLLCKTDWFKAGNRECKLRQYLEGRSFYLSHDGTLFAKFWSSDVCWFSASLTWCYPYILTMIAALRTYWVAESLGTNLDPME